MNLYSFPFTHFPKLFPCTWHVWYNYGDVLAVVATGLWVVVVGVVVIVWLVGVDEPVMPLNHPNHQNFTPTTAAPSW